MARIVAIVVLAALAAMPAAAPAAQRGGAGGAQRRQPAPAAQQPLQNTLQEVPAPVEPAPAPQQADAGSGSIGPTELTLIVVGIAALIGGIWLAISRDARRATAGRPRAGDHALATGRGGSATRAARKSRRLSAGERRRRKRGRAR